MRIVSALTLVALAIPWLSPAQKRDGQAIFQEQCVGCHGPDGRAETEMGKQVQAADLTSGVVQQQSDSQLTKVVRSGKGKMPAWEGKLDDDEIKAVVAYVRSLGKSK